MQLQCAAHGPHICRIDFPANNTTLSHGNHFSAAGRNMRAFAPLSLQFFMGDQSAIKLFCATPCVDLYRVPIVVLIFDVASLFLVNCSGKCLPITARPHWDSLSRNPLFFCARNLARNCFNSSSDFSPKLRIPANIVSSPRSSISTSLHAYNAVRLRGGARTLKVQLLNGRIVPFVGDELLRAFFLFDRSQRLFAYTGRGRFAS